MELIRSSISIVSGLPCEKVRSAPAIVFSGPAQRSLTLWPVRSPSRLATLSIESSDSFVASSAVSIVTGWSEPVPGREFHPLKSSAFSRRTFSTTVRIKCSQLNIFLLRIAGSSTTTTVRDSSKTRKTDNADTNHHLNTGFRPRWRVLRPYPLGSGRRGRHWAGDNIVDSPHRLHAWPVPLIV